MKQTLTRIVRWLSKATGIGYKPLIPLADEPERQASRQATRRLAVRADSVTYQIRRLEQRLRQ